MESIGLRSIAVVVYLFIAVQVVGGVVYVHEHWKMWAKECLDSFPWFSLIMFWALGLCAFIICFKIMEFIVEKVVKPIERRKIEC